MFGFHSAEMKGRTELCAFLYFYFLFEPFHLYHLNKSKYLSFVFFFLAFFPSVGYYGHSHNSALYEAEPNFSRKSIDIEHVSFQTNVDGIKRQLKQNTVPMCGESEMSALMPTKYTVIAAIRYV